MDNIPMTAISEKDPQHQRLFRAIDGLKSGFWQMIIDECEGMSKGEAMNAFIVACSHITSDMAHLEAERLNMTPHILAKRMTHQFTQNVNLRIGLEARKN